MKSKNDAIVIRITGDSGDGIQLVGEQLTLTAALTGHDVRSLPDFPAEIRAPAGTVAGVSGYQLAIADRAIFTAGESLDVLVALNPAALIKGLEFLNPGGLLLINEDNCTDKDWQRVGLDPSWLEQRASHYQLISLPLTRLAEEACAGLELTKPQAKKTKNFYVLGLVLWLFDLPQNNCQAFIEKKFKNKPEIARANQAALMAGYNYALTLELSRQPFVLGHLQRPAGEYRQITGVEAVGLALATIATSCQTSLLVSGYPITPASAILQASAKLSDYGVQLFQAEDEIAALGACLGAAFAGKLALSCTSGPGLDLKSESLGLAVVSELPLVLIDVQRAGVSTGLPTKTGQSDLQQALYGRHGEAPLPVIAATSPANCFDTVLEAFRIAVKYMTPVIVLMDASLANAAEPWLIPEVGSLELPQIHYNQHPQAFHRDEHLARSWNLPGSEGFIYQLGGLEKQGEAGRVSYDPANHQAMVDLRAAKIEKIREAYPPLHLEGNPGAETLLIGWGSTQGSLRAALEECLAQGLDLAYLSLRHLKPFPADLGGLLGHFKRIIVAELNSGQLCQLLRGVYLRDIRSLNQTNGQPFIVSELVRCIKEEMADEQQLSA